MPAVQRERIGRELLKLVGDPDSPKAGDALATVLSVMKQGGVFTVEDVKRQADARGAAPPPKEIYNALGYLKRKGKLRRIGYGRYVGEGIEIDTSEDLGGENARHEDAYRVP